MENKQDLRVFKTKRAIREAFLELRKTTDLEKIKVRDICRLAYINTTTFYNHYEDVPALSNALEDEVLEEAFNAIEGKGELLTNPSKFLAEAPKRIEEKNDVISVLFRDREEVKFAKLTRQLRSYYKTTEMSAGDDIALMFAITGGIQTMYLLQTEGEYPPEQLEAKVAECIASVFPQGRGETAERSAEG